MGADTIITQLFYDGIVFLDVVEYCRGKGIQCRGIMIGSMRAFSNRSD